MVDPRNSLKRELHVLCPTRALWLYLTKTTSVKQVSQLLVSYQAGKQDSLVTKSILSQWIKQTILFCYQHLGDEIPSSSVKAHYT